MSTKIFVIVVYDVGAKRTAKICKICRRYLIHMQKSVFEGSIDSKQLEKLKNTLKKAIDVECDQVTIYKHMGNEIKKDVIGCHISFSNIL